MINQRYSPTRNPGDNIDRKKIKKSPRRDLKYKDPSKKP